MGYSGAQEKLIQEETWSRNSRVRFPLKKHLLMLNAVFAVALLHSTPSPQLTQNRRNCYLSCKDFKKIHLNERVLSILVGGGGEGWSQSISINGDCAIL
jgi:hypothetical protein